MNVSNDKKTRIIETAISVFARKGFRASTISDLAKEAELGEATIYNHFKNKEEILLSIPIQYFQDFISSNKEHLEGIKNPEEKLRKYIWQYLWWSQRHEDFIKVLLLEVQPNHHYYHSESYDLFNRMLQVPMITLKDGMKAGLFREEINPRLFSNFLTGTIHYLFLTRILFDRPFEVLDDFDDVAGAIVAAIKRDEEISAIDISDVEEKKERILLAAEELFSTKTFYETTISEIARMANVADGTIYEYFKNKEDLLFSDFARQMMEFTDIFDETICPKKPETKLRSILCHFLTFVQNHRQWARVYFKDLIPNPRFYQSDQYKPMKDYDIKLASIFEEGQQKNVFKKDLKLYLFRALLLGTIDQICSHWAMLQKEDNLIVLLDDFYELVFNAIKA